MGQLGAVWVTWAPEQWELFPGMLRLPVLFLGLNSRGGLL